MKHFISITSIRCRYNVLYNGTFLRSNEFCWKFKKFCAYDFKYIFIFWEKHKKKKPKEFTLYFILYISDT